MLTESQRSLSLQYEYVAYLVFEFIKNVIFRRRVIHKDWQLLQSAPVGLRARLDVATHVVNDHIS